MLMGNVLMENLLMESVSMENVLMIKITSVDSFRNLGSCVVTVAVVTFGKYVMPKMFSASRRCSWTVGKMYIDSFGINKRGFFTALPGHLTMIEV